MIIDVKTKNYFKNVRQVFLYLSDKCNLLCEQCLYKPNVVKGKAIEIGTSKELLKIFKELNAYKLTILGGEISLYDCENNYENLITLLKYARKIGYEYIRIDTNGQKSEFFDKQEVMTLLDEVSFSMDGYDRETNNVLRGMNTFENSMESLRKLRCYENVKINITTCITKQNTRISGGILPFIENMIDFSYKNGVKQLNFHGVFKMGVPMDTWTGDSHLNPEEWYDSIQIIIDNVQKNRYPIDVRFPVHIVKKEEFDRYPRYYGYCPCKLGERALIHPDGIIRVCSSLLSTPYGVAHYNENEICWNEFNNELSEHKMHEYTPCTNQKALYTEDFCPVCFSLKPYQNEIVWKKSNVEGLKEG